MMKLKFRKSLILNALLFYILFPWLPVVFLFIPYFFTIKLDVVTANFVSISLVFLVEFARHRNARKLGEDMMVILKAMAEIFISVVSIIIAAGVFAEGIKALGGVNILANAVSNLGTGNFCMVWNSFEYSYFKLFSLFCHSDYGKWNCRF